jgi:hypothetical protein
MLLFVVVKILRICKVKKLQPFYIKGAIYNAMHDLVLISSAKVTSHDYANKVFPFLLHRFHIGCTSLGRRRTYFTREREIHGALLGRFIFWNYLCCPFCNISTCSCIGKKFRFLMFLACLCLCLWFNKVTFLCDHHRYEFYIKCIDEGQFILFGEIGEALVSKQVGLYILLNHLVVQI